MYRKRENLVNTICFERIFWGYGRSVMEKIDGNESPQNY
jgi:hypothetical protein